MIVLQPFEGTARALQIVRTVGKAFFTLHRLRGSLVGPETTLFFDRNIEG
jgi:hypothetical protein